jgi:Holliday junction resolvase-like predicted endonuclease
MQNMARRAEPLRPPKTVPRQKPVQAPAPERLAAFQRGLSAESRAAMLLIAKAYRILAQADLRFDVIVVAPGKMPRHIINAFDASR